MAKSTLQVLVDELVGLIQLRNQQVEQQDHGDQEEQVDHGQQHGVTLDFSEISLVEANRNGEERDTGIPHIIEVTSGTKFASSPT